MNELLEEFGLKQKKKSNFSSLSGGQKRRLALAIALIGNPSLVVLDEPAAGLDLQGQAFLKKQINMLREQEVTVLLSTHNVDDATRLADQVIMMAQGHVVAQGSVADQGEQNILEDRNKECLGRGTFGNDHLYSQYRRSTLRPFYANRPIFIGYLAMVSGARLGPCCAAYNYDRCSLKRFIFYRSCSNSAET